MKWTLTPSLLSLLALAGLAHAQEPSALFSQYIGATTATADFSGPSASDLSVSLTICTNFLHGLAAIPAEIPATMLDPILQIQADGVCQFCTSVSQTRVDSCCAVPTSVACFDKFAAGKTAGTTPNSNAATETGATPAATTKDSGGERVNVAQLAGPLMVALGAVAWYL